MRKSTALFFFWALGCGGASDARAEHTTAPAAPMPAVVAIAPTSPPSAKPGPAPARRGQEFDFVTIESLRDAPIGLDTPFAGADIDAVELQKADGTSYFASSIVEVIDSIGLSDSALGAPAGCGSIVSLGDAGALRVRFDVPVALGDRVVVHEADASACGDTETHGTLQETYAVSVGLVNLPEETRSLGDELAHEGVATLAVAPGPT